MRAFYLRLVAGLSVSVFKVLAGIIVAGEKLNLTTRCSGDLPIAMITLDALEKYL
jgi:hypothetical protein